MATSSESAFVSNAGLRKRLEPWLPLALVILLFALNYRELVGFETISPLNESREGRLDGELFVPNQKSPYLIFGLSAYFLVTRLRGLRDRIQPSPPTRSSLPLLLVGLGLGLWGHYTGDLALSVVSLSLSLLATAGFLGGPVAFRAMRLPALLLLLAVPIPSVLLNSLIHWLQTSVASSTGFLLSVVGIENVVSGETIFTPTVAFQVIETCAGLRAMESLVLAAVVYQELIPYSRVYSWLVVLSAPLIGMLTNQLRVLAIVLNPFADVSDDHSTQGLVMIVIGTLILAGFAGLLTRWLPGPKSGAPEDSDPNPPRARWPLSRLALVSIFFLISIAAKFGDRWEVDRPEHRNPTSVPGRVDGWVAEPRRIDQEFFGSTRFTQSILRQYRRSGEELSLLVGVDDRKRPLLSGISPKTRSLGPGWQTVRRASRSLGGCGEVMAQASVQERLGRFAYVLSWQQGTDAYLLEAARDALALDRSPWQRPYDAVSVRISTPVQGPSGEDRERAQRRMVPLVDAVLAALPPPGGRSCD